MMRMSPARLVERGATGGARLEQRQHATGDVTKTMESSWESSHTTGRFALHGAYAYKYRCSRARWDQTVIIGL